VPQIVCPFVDRPFVDRNPIGSGDCTTAGIVCALISGSTLPEAVKLGLACISANVDSLLPAEITRERVRELLG